MRDVNEDVAAFFSSLLSVLSYLVPWRCSLPRQEFMMSSTGTEKMRLQIIKWLPFHISQLQFTFQQSFYLYFCLHF